MINIIQIHIDERGSENMKGRLLSTLIVAISTITLIFAGITTAQPAQPIIGLDPKVSSHPQAATFTINVTISGVTLENTQGFGVTAWEVDISFNSTVLNAFSVQQGPWLKTAGNVFWITPKIDNDAGTVIAAASLFPPKTSGALGSGTLANITFTVMNKGTSDFHFYKTVLRAYNGTGYLIIDHTVVDGFFQYPHGDIDSDGIVSALDLATLGKAYGSIPSSPNWNSDADLNKDDTVNEGDLDILAGNYGAT